MLPGDADLDGDVDAADFGALKKFFSVGNTLGHGDFDGDGRVDLSDFQTIKQHFGQTLPSSGQVPEPSTWVLAMLASLGLLFSRLRRSVV